MLAAFNSNPEDVGTAIVNPPSAPVAACVSPTHESLPPPPPLPRTRKKRKRAAEAEEEEKKEKEKEKGEETARLEKRPCIVKPEETLQRPGNSEGKAPHGTKRQRDTWEEDEGDFQQQRRTKPRITKAQQWPRRAASLSALQTDGRGFGKCATPGKSINMIGTRVSTHFAFLLVALPFLCYPCSALKVGAVLETCLESDVENLRVGMVGINPGSKQYAT
ncbi:MAG: hypothetical protein M1829_004612 [Trizodia sp. TS-e1964]|nr:MAG: hypothetical protein M1829_004612 [Trizodia sp. TS-e1964]